MWHIYAKQEEIDTECVGIVYRQKDVDFDKKNYS